MKFKIFKPTTPSQRNLIQLNKSNLRKSPLLKKKIKGFKNSTGRGSNGQITTWHRGGGHKKRYRQINFNRTKNETCIVTSLEYDPYRTANIASIYNIENHEYAYILAPKNLNVGDIVKSGKNAESKNGHSLSIDKIPVGSLLHSISVKTKKEAQISRAAGTYSQLVENSKLWQDKIKLRGTQKRFK